jgi:hypothetical protein
MRKMAVKRLGVPVSVAVQQQVSVSLHGLVSDERGGRIVRGHSNRN